MPRDCIRTPVKRPDMSSESNWQMDVSVYGTAFYSNLVAFTVPASTELAFAALALAV